MAAAWRPSVSKDEDILDYLSVLESKLLPPFQTLRRLQSTLNPTWLALTHLLNPHCIHCVLCNGNRFRFQTTLPSFKAIEAMAKLDIGRLGVMSQRKLLKYLHPIVRDWMCRKCHHAETMPIQKKRLALEWVREIRRFVAMLARKEDLQKGQARLQHPPIDLTRTPSSDHHPQTCMICTESVTDVSSEKVCFQCNNVVHMECFHRHREFEDMNQEATRTTEHEILHLSCIYCRCIVLSVPRSPAGKAKWSDRRKAAERADSELASSLAESEVGDDEEPWGVHDPEVELDEWLWGERSSSE